MTKTKIVVSEVVVEAPLLRRPTSSFVRPQMHPNYRVIVGILVTVVAVLHNQSLNAHPLLDNRGRHSMITIIHPTRNYHVAELQIHLPARMLHYSWWHQHCVWDLLKWYEYEMALYFWLPSILSLITPTCASPVIICMLLSARRRCRCSVPRY